MITDVDDMLESYIGKDVLGEMQVDLEKILSPKVDFEWKNIVFTFLPHQVENFEKFVDVLNQSKPDLIGIAEVEKYNDFVKRLAEYQQFSNVKNVGTAISEMISKVGEYLQGQEQDQETEWVSLSHLFGTAAVSKETAEIITQALKKNVQPDEKPDKVKLLREWAERAIEG